MAVTAAILTGWRQRAQQLRTELGAAAAELRALLRAVEGAQRIGSGSGSDGLDREACQLQVGSQTVQLTPGLTAILGCMLEAGGRAVPRRQLAQAAFGPYATARQERDMSMQVHRLRRQLPRVAARIETVRGVGYRWKGGGECQ